MPPSVIHAWDRPRKWQYRPARPLIFMPLACCVLKLQAVLVAVLQVMVPYVWRIADDEIEAGWGFACVKSESFIVRPLSFQRRAAGVP